MKIRSAGGELFRAYGETDTTKLTVAFHSFFNGPKGGQYHQTRRFEVLNKWSLSQPLTVRAQCSLCVPPILALSNFSFCPHLEAAQGLRINITFTNVDPNSVDRKRGSIRGG